MDISVKNEVDKIFFDKNYKYLFMKYFHDLKILIIFFLNIEENFFGRIDKNFVIYFLKFNKNIYTKRKSKIIIDAYNFKLENCFLQEDEKEKNLYLFTDDKSYLIRKTNEEICRKLNNYEIQKIKDKNKLIPIILNNPCLYFSGIKCEIIKNLNKCYLIIYPKNFIWPNISKKYLTKEIKNKIFYLILIFKKLNLKNQDFKNLNLKKYFKIIEFIARNKIRKNILVKNKTNHQNYIFLNEWQTKLEKFIFTKLNNCVYWFYSDKCVGKSFIFKYLRDKYDDIIIFSENVDMLCYNVRSAKIRDDKYKMMIMLNSDEKWEDIKYEKINDLLKENKPIIIISDEKPMMYHILKIKIKKIN